MSPCNAISSDSSPSAATAAPLAFLRRERAEILAGACQALRSRAPHYDSGGREQTRRRLETLYDELLAGVADRELGGVVAYAKRVAWQRFAAGYDLSEVQTAMNMLEEAVWKRVVARQEPAGWAETLGLVSTVLGAAKDAVAREYVSLATHAHAPSLDLGALFAGGTPAGPRRDPAEQAAHVLANERSMT
ncbi:MAG TPA: hypothetical protein VFI37_10290 [Gaiellaceae bacterium]|jgi:hypothetical protein|nr:hypothetical protein [Gaiellaceae bacterium]